MVLAHLNHLLVTMALCLLRAEVWASGAQSHLSRVTARVVPSHLLETPTVLAHARLLILGGDRQRLHEELIVAGGYLREGRFERMNEGQSKRAQAATTPQDRLAPETVRQQLAAQYPRHRESLVAALEHRMRERTGSLQKTLAERAAKEQHDIRAERTGTPFTEYF